MNIFFKVIILILISISCANAQVYVNINATGTNNGTSWANAYTSFQTALESATPSTIIWVAQGTYKPNKDATGNIPILDEQKTFSIPDSVQVYGGFNGTETLFSQRNWKIYPTILEGALSSTIKTYHVVTMDAVSLETVLDGFTVQNGAATLSTGNGSYGGGLLGINNPSPIIQNCLFKNNLAYARGGAIYITGDYTEIISCEFNNNRIQGSIGYGGAICFENSSYIKIINSLFHHNLSTDHGGAVYVYGAINEISNCTFADNTRGTAVGDFGKALYFLNTTTSLNKINNCIFYQNYPSTSNDDVGGSYISVNNSLSKNGATNFLTTGSTYTNIITGNPLFVDAASENYKIECGPAMNVGDTTGIVLPSLDLSMQPRVAKGAIDLGAYENQDGVGIIATGLSICAGDYLTLNGTCDSAYTWNNGVIDGVPFIPASTMTYTCTGVQTGQNAQITVNVVTLNDETVSAANKVCLGTTTTVSLADSELGASYFLVNDMSNLIVDGPLSGTGAGLSFNTDAINDTMTYNVYGGVGAIAKTTSKALAFDGTQAVQLTTYLPTTSNYSLETWVYPLTSNFPQTGVIIATYRNVGGGSNPFSEFILQHSGTGGLDFIPKNASAISTQDVLTFNSWNHVAITFDNGTITFYVNGTSVHTALIPTPIYTTGYQLYLGGNNSNNYKLKGKLDDVRIWNKTLTASEILANMNTCLEGTEIDLIAYYDLEEGTGSTTIDKVTGAIGYFGNAITWTKGVVGCDYEVGFPKGKSLDFRLSERVVTSYSMPTTTNFSVEAWISPNATTSKKIISTYSGSGTPNAGDFFFDTYNTTNNGKGLRFTVGNATASVPNVLTLREWNHVAATFNNGTIFLYVNGVNVGTGTGVTSALVSTSQTVTLGEDYTVGTLEYFQGLMDEVRIWNKTLSPSEIAANMNHCLLGNEANLLVYYNFEEGAGSVLNGYPTTIANNGTLTFNGSVTTNMNWEEGSVGCLSTCAQEMTQKVTITPVTVDTTVSLTGLTLMSNATTVNYQWIDCNNNNTPIIGATNQSFTPNANGDYAVIVTDGGCSDTSACINVVGVGLEKIDNSNDIAVYPNPTTGNLTIDLRNMHEDVQVQVSNVMGQVVQELNYSTTQYIDLQLNGASGMYFIKVQTSKGLKSTVQIIKK